MKTILLLLLATSILMSGAVYGQTPTNKADAKDYIDPKLPKPDKKIWLNLLGYFNNARQLAQGSLKEVSAVADFCWASYGYLYAIERAANRAQLVWDNLKNFQAKNFEDNVIYLEERVFQNSDALFYHDIPKIKEQRIRLDSAQTNIRNRTGAFLGQINDLMPDGYKFKIKYLRLMEINSVDARALKDTSDKDIAYHQTVLSIASRQVASTEINNEQSESQSAIMEAGIRNGSNNGNSDPQHQAEYSKINERNTLMLTLQENVQLGDAVKTGALYLLAKTRIYADNLAYKKALLCNLEDFSDALVLQKKKPKK